MTAYLLYNGSASFCRQRAQAVRRRRSESECEERVELPVEDPKPGDLAMARLKAR